MNKKVLLIILDGYGIAPDGPGNAITQANTPYLDSLVADYPAIPLKADSEAVGLPKGTMGGSEVGHYTIGAGRIVLQSLPYINERIETGDFFENEALLSAIEHVKANNSALHFIGMISDAGVHSHIDHLFALLELADRHNITQVFIHGITDGRDVPERSAAKFLEQIQAKLEQYKFAQISDLVGRFYAMDRDNNWQRTQAAFNLYTKGEGQHSESSAGALKKFYLNSDKSDYYLEPTKVGTPKGGLVRSQDSVVFFNYRTDRAKQLTDAFTLNEFNHFERDLAPLPHMVVFGEYSEVAPVCFPAPKAEVNLGKLVSDAGLKQLRIAETEKFPHVTFFFNSQNKEPYPNEDRILIPSPKVASYAEKPEMSAPEITEKLLPEISKDEYSLVVLNYANLDLVGHSGELEATIKATETVDKCLSQLVPHAQKHNYDVIITGDHGNADQMLYEDGSACPSHSMNPTQGILISPATKNLEISNTNAGLQDIAPTIIGILGLEKPTKMTGNSLLP